jgi:hypothetical protein
MSPSSSGTNTMGPIDRAGPYLCSVDWAQLSMNHLMKTGSNLRKVVV